MAVVQYTFTHKQYIEQHKNFGRVRAVPCLGELYPSICLTTEEKARKNLSHSSRTIRIYRPNKSARIRPCTMFPQPEAWSTRCRLHTRLSISVVQSIQFRGRSAVLIDINSNGRPADRPTTRCSRLNKQRSYVPANQDLVTPFHFSSFHRPIFFSFQR